MVGAEINMVVSDCLSALELYKKIFEIQVIEVSSFPKGENEAVFTLHGMQFHMLDENPQFGMVGLKPNEPKAIWFNITVADIEATYNKALNSGCKELQPITHMPEYGVSNAAFEDPFGCQWMLHQIHKVVGFEERVKIWEEGKNK